MEFIKGVTFGYMSRRGDWVDKEAKESLYLMKEVTKANTVILPIVVEQDTAQSTDINWKSDGVLSDKEVKAMIEYAHEIDLKVILKPMVNVSDGTWRAHINFFEMDIPGEPKWSEWFDNYNEFILHYAKIAEEMKCEMFVIGCELVNADRRVNEWKFLIQLIRNVYSGLITYNADKYQESYISWWSELDVISSSGYYPINQWEIQLDRIERVVNTFEKPFFFCEVGCPSREGSEYLPNDWSFRGPVSMESQAEWYLSMFKAGEKRKWLSGFGIWDWKSKLYSLDKAQSNDDYAIYGKDAEVVISRYYLSY